MYVEGEVPYSNGGNNATLAYPVMPYYGMGGFGGGFGNGFGGDLAWIIILIAILGGNGFGGFGGGNNNMLYDINANTNRGFDNLALNSGIDAIQTAVSGLNSSFKDCCCENRLATADLKYTVATENAADRVTINDGIRDIIANDTRNTQLILDKLCQQEIDAKNDLISTLRSQLSMADLRASQVAQTAQIREGQIAEIDALYNRLATCPVGTMPVYGNQPIFTCNGNGCGCGSVQ